MPIINGKKRYIPETGQETSVEKKRYQPEEKTIVQTVVKRYQKGQGTTSETSVTPESEKKLVGAYEFDVRIDMVQVCFSKITNIGSEIEIESFVEGGNNNYPIIRQKPRQNPETIIFEKGIVNHGGTDLFSLICQGMKLANILIFVKQQGSIVKTYSIDEGMVVSRKFSDLDANSSSIFIEKLELAHTGLSAVSI